MASWSATAIPDQEGKSVLALLSTLKLVNSLIGVRSGGPSFRSSVRTLALPYLLASGCGPKCLYGRISLFFSFIIKVSVIQFQVENKVTVNGGNGQKRSAYLDCWQMTFVRFKFQMKL